MVDRAWHGNGAATPEGLRGQKGMRLERLPITDGWRARLRRLDQQLWVARPGLGKNESGGCDGGTGGGQTRDAPLGQEEFCVRVQVAEPQLGGTRREGGAGRGNGCEPTLTPSFPSAAPAGHAELQPPRPSVRPRPAATSVALPPGHASGTSLLSRKPRGGRLTTASPIDAAAKCLMFETLKMSVVKSLRLLLQTLGPFLLFGAIPWLGADVLASPPPSLTPLEPGAFLCLL